MASARRPGVGPKPRQRLDFPPMRHALLAALPIALALALGGSLRAQLPPPTVPPQNPLTPQKAVLGKILFWEEQLSSADDVACGTCHQARAGGGDPRRALPGTAIHPGPDGLLGTADDGLGSPGIVRTAPNGAFTAEPTFGLRRQVTARLANPHIGAAFHASLFWDGRASTVFRDPLTDQIVIPFDGALESQALGPILSPVEMGREGRTWADVTGKLQQITPLRLASNLPADVQQALQAQPGYPALFQQAFGDPAITPVRIAFALASYQRTLVPDQTPWDRYMRGDPLALTPNQIAGMLLFDGAARCNACHPAPLFSDDTFHNLGVRPWQEDPGLMGVTAITADRGAFKTPSLRNAGLRPRLLHNGAMPALGDPAGLGDPHSMVEFYFNGGGAFPDNLDPFLLPLSQHGVTRGDLRKVEDFVKHALTDPRVAQGLPPFDQPTLRSSRPDARVYGPELVASTGAAPFLVEPDPAYPGNQGFRLGLAADRPGTLALLAWSPLAVEPALWAGGIPLQVGQPSGSAAFVLGGAAGGPGHLTWPAPLPADPRLAGVTVHLQLFTVDAASAVGVAASRGLSISVR